MPDLGRYVDRSNAKVLTLHGFSAFTFEPTLDTLHVFPMLAAAPGISHYLNLACCS